MAKELIISRTQSEYRVAMIENREILDLLIDRGLESRENKVVVGDIYLGRVSRVLPGMQAAFVDIGQDKAAFLYVDDAYIPTIEEQRDHAKRIEKLKKERENKKVGEIIPDEMSTLSETVDLKFRPDIRIQDFLKEGQAILVQIAKEPISTKGPRITRHITLPGRHIVFMPFIEHVGVSRRIEGEKERLRLKEALESIKVENTGIIARTVSDGHSYKVLKSDYNMLVKIWKEIQKKVDGAKAPSLVYKDLDFLQRALRDITDEDVDQILVDDKGTQKQIQKFVSKFLPVMKDKIKLYTQEAPIFEYYGIDIEIERALSNQVYLKSGGSINVDQTEALVSVDVNTGKFVGKRTPEETILKTNLEAVREIAYQLRLRNCGGIIIIDFIDMEKEEHRHQVFTTLLEALKKDRAKTNVMPISGLGLVEMTRKRTRDTLVRVMCNTCQYCEGTGSVKTAETVGFEILREVGKVSKNSDANKVSIFTHPEVSSLLSGQAYSMLEVIEENYNKVITVRADNSFHIEQYEVYIHEN